MKKRLILLSLGLTVFNIIISYANPPLKIPYQAVLRTPAGAILSNQPTVIKASIVMGQATNTPVYSEIHSVVSNPFGIISIAIGNGTPEIGSFDEIDWKSGVSFLKIEVDYQNSGTYTLIGTSQILSVPYALRSGGNLDQLPGQQGEIISHDGDKWAAYDKVRVNSTGVTIDAAQSKNPDDPIFQIKNQAGETLFTVNSKGVEIKLSDDGVDNGAFSVQGRNTSNKYLVIAPDSTRIQFNTQNNKAAKGGFVIGGVSAGKSITTPYFVLNPTISLFNFDLQGAGKAAKGGFAIGGVSSGKSTINLFAINPDSTNLFIDTDSSKAAKGGFAIGGVSAGKTSNNNYFTLSPIGTQILFDESSQKAAKGGFAIGGVSAGKSILSDFLNISQNDTKFLLVENGGKNIGGFSIGGYLNNGEQFTSFFNLNPVSVIINTTVTSTEEIYVGGDINVEGDIIFTPTLTTDLIAEITHVTAIAVGTLIEDGGGEISSFGFIWDTIPNTTIERFVGQCIMPEVMFTQYWCQLLGLYPGKTYFVKAYATNIAGTSYGEELSFTTNLPEINCPEIATPTIVNAEMNYIHLESNVSSGENLELIETGMVAGLTENPILGVNSIHFTVPDGQFGSFESYFYDLLFDTTYYIRAYAVVGDSNYPGFDITCYSEQISYRTQPMPAPVHFSFSYNMLYDEAIAYIYVDHYAPSYEKVGCFWSKNSDFNYSNAIGNTEMYYDDSIQGSYEFEISGLDAETKYYVKTYIISGQDTIYGSYNEDYDYFETGPYPAKLLEVYDITSNGALVEGIFYYYEELEVIEAGFVWGESETVDIDNNLDKAVNAQWSEEMSYFIDSLEENTNYYVKSYVVFNNDTCYSEAQSFITESQYGTVVDASGNEYETKYIGRYSWMTRNLRTLKYSDSTDVNTTDVVEPFVQDSLERFGRLYSKYTTVSHQTQQPYKNICPEGWRIPGPDEWHDLNLNAGYSGYNLRDSSAAWENGNSNQNSTGFTGLPAGYYSLPTNSYNEYGQSANFWGESNGSLPFYSYLGYDADLNMLELDMEEKYYSIRCIKNVIHKASIYTTTGAKTTHNSVYFEFIVSSTGNSFNGVTGYIIDTTPEVNLDNYVKKTEQALKVGFIRGVLTNLNSSTTYYVRAYAINERDTVYSYTWDVETDPENELSVFDNSGYKYPVVKIGNQEWMAENLKVEDYNNYDDISQFETYPYWMLASDPSLYECGNYYQNGVVTDIRGICPQGWQMPRNDDWNELITYLGGADVAGEKLKSVEHEYAQWSSNPGDGSTGFNALPAGYFLPEYEYVHINEVAQFWSKDIYDLSNGYCYKLSSNNDSIVIEQFDNTIALNVRCVKTQEGKDYHANIVLKQPVETSPNSVNLEVQVIDEGNMTEVDREFIVSEMPECTFENGQTYSANSDFTAEITDLVSDKTYYFRAAIIYQNDTLYSNIVDYATKKLQGEGTTENPYQIENIADLMYLSENGDLWNKHFIQIADIDASSTMVEGFNPIGGYRPSLADTSFSGSYNGNGFSINDLHIISTGKAIGLFAHTENVTIRKINLNNINFSGQSTTGGVVATAHNGIIDSCSVNGTITNQGSHTGGIAGKIDSTTITNCSFSGNIVGRNLVAGITGFLDNSTVKKCSSGGTIAGEDYIGGIIGYSQFIDSLYQCYNTANISSSSFAGGLVGYCYHPGCLPEISNCYSTGDVYANSRAGGAIGDSYSRLEFNYCYSTGRVSEPNNPKGLVGTTYIDVIPNYSYFLNYGGYVDTTGKRGIDKMIVESNYQNWDFTNIWTINPDTTFPYLRWQGEPSEHNIAVYVKDIDNNHYLIAKIGNQEWMAENLKVEHYNNGDEISQIGTYPYWVPAQDSTIQYEFGNYYQNGVVTDSRGICPQGWQVPRNDDWNELITYLEGADVAGKKLKSIGQLGATIWNNNAGDGSTLFNAFPAGHVMDGMDYMDYGFEARFWSKDLYDLSNGYCYKLSNNNDSIVTEHFGYERALNVRCVKIQEGKEYHANIILNEPIGISPTSVNLTVQIIDEGNMAENSRKFIVSEIPECTFAGGQTYDATDDFTAEITGLVTGKTYYYIAAILYQNDTLYSNIVEYATSRFQGEGTTENPFQITNIADLTYLSENDDLWNKHFIQTADIDASSTNSGKGFNPIGGNRQNLADTTFSGSYNGNGFTISKLYINSTGSPVGLFGATHNATIKNINLDSVNFTGKGTAGGIVANAYQGVIDSCSVSGTITNQGEYTGGIAGIASTVTNCSFNGDITGKDNTAGIIGYSGQGTMKNCSSSGTITGEEMVGGIIGYVYTLDTLYQCYNTAIISSLSYAGGLIGYCNQSGNSLEFSNCYNTGDVFADTIAGGVIGGNISTFEFSYCYSIGRVLEPNNPKGLVGTTYIDVIPNYSYFLNYGGYVDTTGKRGIDKMIVESNYQNWDFTNIWTINPDTTFPYLRWQGEPSEHNIAVYVKDIDNNHYLIAKIGNQEWMAENLKVEHYNNGDEISQPGTYPFWVPAQNSTIQYEFGNYYQNGVVTDSRGICPQGWQVPRNDDWNELITYLEGADVAGKKLKSIGQLGATIWNNNTGDGSTLFNAFPAGHVMDGMDYMDYGFEARFWSKDLYDLPNGYCYKLSNNNDSIVTEHFGYERALNVRCVKIQAGKEYHANIVLKQPIEISHDSVILEVQIIDEGNMTEVDRKFIVSETPDCTFGNGQIYNANSEFTAVITGLLHDTVYYYRAAIIYPNDTLYSNIINYTTQRFKGEGTIENPYQIENIADLMYLSENDNLWNKHFIQIADIDASSTTGDGFNPIGENRSGVADTTFRGSYNGNGFIINNLYINSTGKPVGLFGYTHNATIRKINLNNVNFTGQGATGGVVATARNGIIDSCSVNGTITNQGDYTGGIAGEIDSTTITNCCFSGNIVGRSLVAGITGFLDNGGTIKKCSSSGTIAGETQVGGIIGYSQFIDSLYQCYNTANISSSSFAGGLVGYCYHPGSLPEISNCYNTGDVYADSCAGGAIGESYSTLKFSYCYSTGRVSEPNNPRGLVGTTYIDVIPNYSYFLHYGGYYVDTTGGRRIDKIISKNNYQDWDFTNIWAINEGTTLPYLRWQGTPGEHNTANYVKDNNNYHYITVKIGNQEWMAENLKVENYNNGEEINEWLPASDTTIQYEYGNYYSNSVVTDSRGICPTGWQMPRNDDWDELITYLGGVGVAGKKLKSIGKYGITIWNNNTGDGSTGFCAYPAGIYVEEYIGMGNRTMFWSKDLYDSLNVYCYVLRDDNDSIATYHYDDMPLLNVRCVKTQEGKEYHSNIILKQPIDISQTSVKLEVQVVTEGGITESGRKFIVSETPDCTLENGITYDAAEDFTAEITDLVCAKTYYYRAAIIYQDDTIYSNTVEHATIKFLGKGTEEEPYQIKDISDLAYLSTNGKFWDKYFIQVADINASSAASEGFNPIGGLGGGGGSIFFTGSYNGNGFSIDSLHLSSTEESLGLFEYVDGAIIRKVKLNNVNINCQSSGSAGGIVALAQYGAIIDSCSVTGTITNQGTQTGGIVGFTSAITITNCSFNGTIVGKNNTAGIAGYLSQGNVENCSSNGTITGQDKVGGIAGYADYSDSVVQCYNTANITASSHVGGIVGYCDPSYANQFVIRNSYNTGDIYADTCAGGIIGKQSSNERTIAVTNCYSTGRVSEPGAPKGLVGEAFGINLNNSYFLHYDDTADTIGERNIEKMIVQNNYTDWDFLNVWNINEGTTFPFLRWQGTPDEHNANFIMDVDNNYYITVKIGDQTWMAENLKVTKTNNSEINILPSDSDTWDDTESRYYYIAGGSPEDQGLLYNGTAALLNNICPTGWKVPGTSDFNVLKNYIKDILGYESIEGKALKSRYSWIMYKGDNATGFSAVPVGYIDENGDWTEIENSACFWTKETQEENLYYWKLFDDENHEILDGYVPKTYGYSIRCIKE